MKILKRLKEAFTGRSVTKLINVNDFFNTCYNYRRLKDAPEIKAALNYISDTVANITIQLYENTDQGNKKIKNALSKKINVNPYKYYTRQQFIKFIVDNLLLYGNAIIYPKFKDGLIDELIPIPKDNYELLEDVKTDYKIIISGETYYPNQVLHFKLNPNTHTPWKGEGIKIDLEELSRSIIDLGDAKNEINKTIVLGVDSMAEELFTEEGQEQLTKKFIDDNGKIRPVIIVPSGLIKVEQIQQTSLTETGLEQSIKLNREKIAGLLGVPAFLLGVGTYKKEEYQHFIRTKITTITKAIEQELTQKLLIADNLFFKFNINSLLNNDLVELANVYTALYSRGLITGNEVRDIFDLNPKEELEGFIMLENYIPMELIDKQNKLSGNTDGKEETE